jgi:chemotaxis-related protein WspB
MSTRIIVVRHPHDEAGLIGLIAENVTEMLRLDPAQFAPFAPGPHGLVQRVELKDLLPAALPALVASR